MTSGWLLLPKVESARDFFVKRFSKVLVPFIVWSGLYLLDVCGPTLGHCDRLWLSRLIFLHGTYHHLWFLYPLLGIYLVVPILRLLVVTDQKPLLWYLVALWLIFQPILELAEIYLDFKTLFTVPLTTGFVGFFILGYLLGELRLSRNIFCIAAVVWILSAVFTCVATYYLNSSARQFNYFFYGYLSLNVIINSACGFIGLKWLADHSWLSMGWPSSVIRTFSATSFGIYLIHPFTLVLIGDRNPFIKINTEIGNPVWSIPVVSVLVFLLSFGAVFVMQKSLLLKRIVPS